MARCSRLASMPGPCSDRAKPVGVNAATETQRAPSPNCHPGGEAGRVAVWLKILSHYKTNLRQKGSRFKREIIVLHYAQTIQMPSTDQLVAACKVKV
jgi:hypothetical protein